MKTEHKVGTFDTQTWAGEQTTKVRRHKDTVVGLLTVSSVQQG